MSIHSTPRSHRLHIALFGKRNAGKSSLINALTDQAIAIVSEVKGTTTDPVYKSMEILPLGPTVLIDTPGLDDLGTLGELRKEKTYEVLNKTDIALIVIDSNEALSDFDIAIIEQVKGKKIPFLIVLNKMDKRTEDPTWLNELNVSGTPLIKVSATEKTGLEELKKQLSLLTDTDEDKFKIIGDLLLPGDIAILVTPIDKAAPKGRLILPQQQTIRDILESDAMAIVTKEHELRETLDALTRKPKIVITDSQAFLKVAADTPKDIWMTSFSILFARFKGDLIELLKGAKTIPLLNDGDKVLISEACTHHRQADDIGRVKIPRFIRQLTGKQIHFDYTSGTEFSKDVQQYKLIVHCGACMLNRREMQHRISTSQSFGVPIVNYGILIAYVQGIIERAIEPFPLAKMLWQDM